MEFSVDPRSPLPPYAQIVRALLDAVARGELGEGARLPSVRKLATDVLVNPNTAARAYRELEQLNVVASRIGDGVFVTKAGPERARTLRQEQTANELERAAEAARLAGLDRERALQLVQGAWSRESVGVTHPIEEPTS